MRPSITVFCDRKQGIHILNDSVEAKVNQQTYTSP